jgi:single-strand DNA-binding protein
MANLNRCLLIGNLTRDPETRTTPQGTAVCDIGLAVNRVTKDDAGNKKEEVAFIDVTLWGRQAEIVQQYCTKGKPLFVEGRLQLDSWADKNSGEKRTKLKVVGENVQLLGAKGDGGQSEMPPSNGINRMAKVTTQPPPASRPFNPGIHSEETDTIPF